MFAVAYRHTEAGIRALHKRIATFETGAKIEPPENKWKHTVIVTPFKRIEMRACKVFRVSMSELKSSRRGGNIWLARQFVMYWTMRLTLMSTPQIGRLLGGRDHSTILHGREKYIARRREMGRTLRPVR